MDKFYTRDEVLARLRHPSCVGQCARLSLSVGETAWDPMRFNSVIVGPAVVEYLGYSGGVVCLVFPSLPVSR